MEVREVSERFPCGEVEETFSDYIVVSWVMWLFFVPWQLGPCGIHNAVRFGIILQLTILLSVFVYGA